MDSAAAKKQLSSKKYNYMMQGYNPQQAEALAKKDMGLEDTLPPPRAEIDKSTVTGQRYPSGHFDELPTDRVVSRFDVEAQQNIGKPFSGQYAQPNQQKSSLLKSKGITPEELHSLRSMYKKKGVQKSDEDLAQEIFQSKQHFSKERAKQTLSSLPRHPGVKSPEQIQQQATQKPQDIKQRISKLKIKREDLIKMSKLNLTESQVKAVVRKAVVLAERKKYAKKVIRENMKEQRKVAYLIETILEQGQNSGIWGGIKGAIGSAAQAFGIGQSTAKDTGMQQAQNELVKGIKQAQSVRQKFNSQIMKNAELVNQYHDSVMGVLQVFQQVGQALGPNAQKIGEEINQLLGQFHRDLESEKQGIETYLDSLTKAAPEAKKVAANLNKAAAEGPQVGPGQTKVAQGERRAMNPKVAMSPSQLYKGNPAPQQAAVPQRGAQDSVAEFEQFVSSKYGPEMMQKTSKKVLDKAYQKFMEKKYGTKDAESPYRSKSKTNKK